MTMMMRILMSGAGFAAFAAAAPVTAQYAYPYGHNSYATNMAAERCTAAVQNRLSHRGNNNGILGAIFGANNYNNARVLSVTQVAPNRNSVRVRGVASSGRVAYNPYGVGAYGMLGSNYAADLSFRCNVDYRGYVRDVDINRR